jgi:methyl-accepting chemotaxis protein
MKIGDNMKTEMSSYLVEEKNSRDAGRLAAEQALLKLESGKADFCLFFASILYNFDEIIEGIKSVIGDDAQIIGCSSCGEFTSEKIGSNGLALSLMSSEKYTFKARAYSGISNDLEGVVRKITGELKDFTDSSELFSVLMFADGLSGKGEEAVLSIFTAYNADVKIFGGLAGDNFKLNQTIVSANETVCNDGISLCIISGGDIFGSGIKHGYKPMSAPLLATKASGNILYTINNRPAWQVWKDTVRDKARKNGMDVDRLNSKEDLLQLFLRYELGLLTENGYKIRVPLSKNDDDSLNFGSSIHEGITFRIMDGSIEGQIESAENAARSAIKDLAGRKPIGAFVFDCVCRASVLGDCYSNAIEAIKKEIGDIPLIGFESYGEICINPIQLSGFHNTTTVIALITD